MPFTPKRLAQFVAPVAETSYYTVPPDTLALVKQAVVANTSGAPASLFLSVVPAGGVAGNQNRVVPGTSIPPGASAVLDLTTVMAAGDFISARSDVAGALTVTVSGAEEPGSNGASSGTVVGSPPAFGSPVAADGVANADGVSTLLARADHKHRAGPLVVPNIAARDSLVPFDGLIVYVASNWTYYGWRATQWVALQDVNFSGTAPVAVSLTAASAGASTSVARADHRHKLDDTGWQTPTYQNGWVNYDNLYGPAGYRRIGGITYLRGLIRSGTMGAVAFVLPGGYRPGIKYLFGVDRDTQAHGRMDIGTDGTVVPVFGAAGYFQITCCFVAEN